MKTVRTSVDDWANLFPPPLQPCVHRGAKRDQYIQSLELENRALTLTVMNAIPPVKHKMFTLLPM